jgi:hypothetical protein
LFLAERLFGFETVLTARIRNRLAVWQALGFVDASCVDRRWLETLGELFEPGVEVPAEVMGVADSDLDLVRMVLRPQVDRITSLTRTAAIDADSSSNLTTF